ncbi:DUF58 domain-containing protein [Clostridium grantii]|uniref:DUF58 domain-containing protein n=1 Tax=Clostridium grantii DSM 8605 TaxID=1121316 RepID=A0A1M5XAK6_9CLOT|nr:DUF58 domain-containing protein [Clostridium grantii]SHH96907.1 Protein of unknown function DUF58 [Clostridium grantii DSM 8605]
MKDQIFDGDFFKQLENISLNVRMLMKEGAAGGRKSKAKGSSVEFSDFREYTMGDDFRRIDWNAYGRFDKLFVKIFMEEREAFVNIFIDSSKSMDYGELKKSTQALKISAILSYLSLNNYDRVCINNIQDSSFRNSTTFMGRNMFNSCINYLKEIKFEGNTNIGESIKKKSFYAGGVAIIISDFFTKGNLEEIVKYLIFKKQQVILIHILSNEELNPELQGQIRLIDSETQESKNIFITSQLLNKYKNHLKEFSNNIKEFSKKLGADYIFVSSNDEIEKVVFENLIKLDVIR